MTIDTTRPGGPDDVKAILRAIKGNLEYQQESVGVLIAEVRDSLRGRAVNTVKDAIVELQNRLLSEMQALRDGLRGGGGGFPGGPRTGGGLAGGPDTEFQRSELSILNAINARLGELETEISVLGETLSGGGRRGGGRTNAFSYEAEVSRIDATNNLVGILRSQRTSSEKMTEFVNAFIRDGGIIHNQYQYRQKESLRGLIDLGTKSTDLINIFEKLGGFIKTQIVDRYQTLFLKDRSLGLTGSQTFFDDFSRILERGFVNAGYGHNVTTEAVKRASEAGGSPSTLLFGQNIAQMSQKFDQIAKAMEGRGTNPMNTFSPSQFMQFVQNQADLMKQSGIFAKMAPDQQVALMQRSLVFFSDIAKYTGISADKLAELAKKTEQEANELQALGQLSATQRMAYQNNAAVLESLGPGGKELKSIYVDWLKAARNPALFFGNNPDALLANQMTGGSIERMLRDLDGIMLKQGTAQQTLEGIMRATGQAGNLQADPTVAAALNQRQGGVGRLLGAIQGVKGYDISQLQNYQKPPETDSIKNFAAQIDNLNAKWPQLGQVVTGLIGAAGHAVTFGLELYAATKILSAWRGGVAAATAATTGGGAAAGGAAGGVLSRFGGVARAAGPVLGGVGGAIGAAADGSSTAGVIGAGLGGASGTYIGMAIGTAIAPGIGTAVGGVLGGLIGSYLGQKGGETVGGSATQPAVPAPSKVLGPAAAEAAAMTNTAYQDSSLSLLTQIVQVGVQGNAILGQMYELARRGSGNPAAAAEAAAVGGIPSFGATPVSGTSRPDASYPWISHS